MAEWLKAHAWKACLGETLTRVRIPLSPPHSAIATKSSKPSTCQTPSLLLRSALGFFGYHLAVLPNVDRRAVHPRDLPRSTRNGRHGPLHGLKKPLVFRRYFRLFHGPASINLGVAPE